MFKAMLIQFNLNLASTQFWFWIKLQEANEPGVDSFQSIDSEQNRYQGTTAIVKEHYDTA